MDDLCSRLCTLSGWLYPLGHSLMTGDYRFGEHKETCKVLVLLFILEFSLEYQFLDFGVVDKAGEDGICFPNSQRVKLRRPN